MKLLKAVEGYLLECSTGDYSPNTIRLYRINLSFFAKWIGDVNVDEITPLDLTLYP
jgi:hypothetical protein